MDFGCGKCGTRKEGEGGFVWQGALLRHTHLTRNPRTTSTIMNNASKDAKVALFANCIRKWFCFVLLVCLLVCDVDCC